MHLLLLTGAVHTCLLQLGRNCHPPHCTHAFYHLAGTVICHTTHAFALLGRNCHLPCYIHIHSIEAITVISNNKHAFILVDRSCRLPPYTRICTLHLLAGPFAYLFTSTCIISLETSVHAVVAQTVFTTICGT